MWKCCNCGERFDEPEEKDTTYEFWYGVDTLIGGRTPLTLYLCPYCNSEEIEECDEDDEEEGDDDE